MRVLGVDPGSRASGWAVVDFSPSPSLSSSGVLRPAAGLSFPERLLALHDGLLAVIDRERPDGAAIERVFQGVNPQSLIALGEARGVLLLALARRGLPIGELAPADVKRSITGSGAADKEQVRRMVASLLPAAGRRKLPLDAADAAAVALAWGYRIAVRSARFTAAPTAGPPREVVASPGAVAPAWRRRPSG